MSERTASYLSDFQALERARHEPRWLHERRAVAIERFRALGFPTTRDEDWKYTSVAPIAETRFAVANGRAQRLSAADIAPLCWQGSEHVQLVFVNGRFDAALSTAGDLSAGVRAGSLAEDLDCDRLEAHLCRHAGFTEQAFVALNTAFFSDGALIVVPRGAVVEKPVHLVFVTSDGGVPAAAYARNLIVLEEDSEAVVVETHAARCAPPAARMLANTVTEIIAGRNARLTHCKIGRESGDAFHVGTVHAHLEARGNLSSHVISLGGALVRNDVVAVLGGEGAECTLNGLFLGGRSEHIDNHTRIDHVGPHGTSRELYKGILDERARGIFNGRITVHKGAQHTDARQTNRNLLLSDHAQVNTKPQLEIHADDVKCSHGSTIGQLDPDQLFYMRSRGIGPAEARALLTFAFASEIVAAIPVAPARAELERAVRAKLGRGPEAVR